jgi:hypothetical protein
MVGLAAGDGSAKGTPYCVGAIGVEWNGTWGESGKDAKVFGCW